MERQFREPRRQDPYRSTTKPRGTPQCRDCGSFLIRGKWYPEAEALERLGAVRKIAPPRGGQFVARGSQPARRPRQAMKPAPEWHEHPSARCPACQQLKDRYAQGVVEIHGKYWRRHRKEIDDAIRNTEKVARARNDQQRILWKHLSRGVLKYYVSLPDLARQIGRVLNRAYKGKLEHHRSTEEYYLRIVWNSDPESLAEDRKRPVARSARKWRGRGTRVDARQGASKFAKGKAGTR